MKRISIRNLDIIYRKMNRNVLREHFENNADTIKRCNVSIILLIISLFSVLLLMGEIKKKLATSEISVEPPYYLIKKDSNCYYPFK